MLKPSIKGFEKPLRYIGKEYNSVIKLDPPAKFLLAFPDVYEIGMTHFGSRILYESINYNSPYYMERVYMPWKDMYAHMKNHSLTLKSLETASLFSSFDGLGFSSSTELSYTNILAMLDLGGINLLADKRGGDDPIVFLGGVASLNPAPMKDFIDVFVIGEADLLIQDILKILANVKNRNERLKELSTH